VLVVLAPLFLLGHLALIAVRVGNNLDRIIVTPPPAAAAPRLSVPSTTPTTTRQATAVVLLEPHEPRRYGGLLAEHDSTIVAPAAVNKQLPASATQPLPTSTPLIPQVVRSDDPPLISVLPTPVALPSIVAGRVAPGQSANTQGFTAQTSASGVTILLLGIDRRPGESGIPRTDALMLLRIDPVTQRVALLSLPRDLWVPIPGFGLNRINSAFVWGEYYGWPGGGWALVRETVSNLIDAPVDHVAMVDFASFVRIIDAVGGVTIDVEQALYDAAYPTMDYGYTTAYFAVGEQIMDGEAALIYSRIRHPDSDFERVRRQQSILVAIGQKLRERGELRNLLDAEALSEALVGNVQTDMPRAQILELAWNLRNIDLAAIERYRVSPAMVSRGFDNDVYALVPDETQVRRLIDTFLFGEQTP
jgi:LCP family protein required for cell wall assembly